MSVQGEVSGGAGGRLKAARMQRGLSLAQLAVQLKVAENRLAALETERWDDLPPGPYARGLATAVCRALALDAAPVLALMPGAAPVALDRVHEGLNRPFDPRASLASGASRSLLGVAALVLVLGAGLWVWHTGEWQGLWPQSTPMTMADTGVAPEGVRHVEAPLVVEPVVASAAARTAPASAPAPVPVASAAPAGVTTAQGAASAVAAAPAGLPSSTPAAPVRSDTPAVALATEGLSIRAREATWVSVSDAAGASLVRRNLAAGELVQLEPAKAPLLVVLGNASGAEVQWRGQPQDLTAFYASRVARLTLN